MDRASTKKKNIISDFKYGENHFLFLGYISVHYTNFSTVNYCGKVIKDGGIVYVEAMRYALNIINKNNSEFLFGMKARFKILDTCRNTGTLARLFPYTLSGYYMGVIGPTSSDEASLAAVVHGSREAAVVSHEATSSMFENRETYRNFFRTVPSDALQVKALVDTVKYFNWSYISTIHSDGEYGQRGIASFSLLAESKKICIAKNIPLPPHPTENDYRTAIESLTAATKAKVVIMFTLPEDTRELIKMAGNLKVNTITWISSTGWKEDAVGTQKDGGKGALILKPADSADVHFMEYFMNLKANTNNYEWFREFWSDVFNCTFGGTVNKCSGNESLINSHFISKYAAVEPVLNAVQSIACSLRKSIIERCPKKTLTCINRIKSQTYNFEKDVVKFLRTGNSTCPELLHTVNMNKYGYYYRDFHIMNFNGSDYTQVGVWRYNETTQRRSLQFKENADIIWAQGKLPLSYCSLPCKAGEIKTPGERSSSCCFKCQKCGMNDIVVNGSCKTCDEHTKANAARLACNVLPSAYMEVDGVAGVATIISSSIGIILNTAVLVFFIKYKNSRIVKASSRELSLIILIALYICFVSPLIFLMKPFLIVCGLQRFIIGISLAGCYTPLMLKTNRIYRIFTAAKVMTSKPALVSPKSQIIMCTSLIGVQLLLGITWVVGDPPKVISMNIQNDTKVAVYCKTKAFNVVLNLVPCLVVMAISTVYAYKTRKFPSNFNEAVNIGITMYVSCFIWGVFITLIFFLETNKENVFALTFIIADFPIAIGLVSLFGLFGPMVKKLITQQDVNPGQEFFSEVPREVTTQQSLAKNAPTTLAVITEDETIDPAKEIAARRRVVTMDTGTNT